MHVIYLFFRIWYIYILACEGYSFEITVLDGLLFEKDEGRQYIRISQDFKANCHNNRSQHLLSQWKKPPSAVCELHQIWILSTLIFLFLLCTSIINLDELVGNGLDPKKYNLERKVATPIFHFFFKPKDSSGKNIRQLLSNFLSPVSVCIQSKSKYGLSPITCQNDLWKQLIAVALF